MRKALLVVSIIASALLFSSMVFAAAWNVPNNVRMVQKSNIDNNGRIYSSIQQAINSITTASAANPYLVKIMPGIYNESVTMKPFVSLAGSGEAATTINGGITGASDSEISDLSVIAGGTGIYNLNAAPKIRNVTITVSGGAANGIYNYINAPGVGNILIENVKIFIVSDGGSVYGIATIGEWNGSGYNTATCIVRNSRISINAGNVVDMYAVAGIYGNGYSGVDVDSTNIEATVAAGGTRYPVGAYMQSGTISNSKITVKGDSPFSIGIRVFGGSDVTTRIYNTYIDAPDPIVNMYNGTIKCINAYDANLALVCSVP